MTVTAKHAWFRKTVLAVAATFVLGGCVYPGYGRDAYYGDGSRHHEWREHESREHEWREHQSYYGNSYSQQQGYWGR